MNRTELPNNRTNPYLITFAQFSSTLVYLSSSELKLSTMWCTWKITTCYIHYKVLPHMRFILKLNLTFQIVEPLDVRHMSMMTHLGGRNSLHALLKESLLVMLRIKRLIRYLCPQNGTSSFPPMSSSMTLLGWVATSRLMGRINSSTVHSDQHSISQLQLPPSRLNTLKQNQLWLPLIQTLSWTSHSCLLQ